MDGQSWWPCNVNGLCQCAEGPIPVTTKLLATTSAIPSTTPVQTSTIPAKSCRTCNSCTSIPGNPHGATAEQCMPCAMDGQSWWPCDTNGLCQCAEPGPLTTTTVTTTK